MVIKNVYEFCNRHIAKGMYSVGRHVPEKVRDFAGGKAGLYGSIIALGTGIFFPPMFYVGCGVLSVYKTCEVTNEIEDLRESGLETAIDSGERK